MVGKKISSNLFSSITNPLEDEELIERFAETVCSNAKQLFLRYCPSIQTIPLNQGMRWKPSWKVGLGLATYVKMSNSKNYMKGKSPFLVQHWELRAFRALVDTTRGVHGQCAQG